MRNDRRRRKSGGFFFGLLQFRELLKCLLASLKVIQVTQCLLASLKITKAQLDLGETLKCSAHTAEDKLDRRFSAWDPGAWCWGHSLRAGGAPCVNQLGQ